MMQSRELIFRALENKDTPRTPWVPFVGCHGAFLQDMAAEDYFKNAQAIVNGALRAYELYRPDGLPVLFDLQLEAEALGCAVQFSQHNPPAVVGHPLEVDPDPSRLPLLTGREARLPVAMEAARCIVEQLGQKIAIYGLITGPFTLALHLRGTDIFYDLLDEPQTAIKIIDYCTQVCIQMADLYIKAGVDIIALVDPMTSQISEANFIEFVSEPAKRIFSHIRARGVYSSFFVCGNAKRNIEQMCLCGPDNVSIDENIPLDYVKEIAGKYGVSIGGNIQLTVTMLMGTPQDNITDAANCAAIGANRGFILAPGCDMPYGTPVVNVQAIAAYVHGEEGEFLLRHGDAARREFVYTPEEFAALPYVKVDVVTLDSGSCAPCQYMMEAVRAAAEGLDWLQVQEHKITTSEGLGAMGTLGVKAIPSIVVDGQVAFASIIPEQAGLRGAFERAAEIKGL